MTHMHIPDGIMPVWLWVSGLIVMAALLAFCLLRLRAMDMKKKIPLLGTMSAAMLVAMSIEIPVILYHINLSVATGILLGPALGFVAAFISNLILALMGHGGITVLGLNTILLGSEAVLGHVLFYTLRKRMPVFWQAGLATVLTLCAATLALVGIVAASDIRLEQLMHGNEEGHAQGNVSISMFSYLVFGLGLFGWMIEAAITGAVIRFISQVKPDLLEHALHGTVRERGMS